MMMRALRNKGKEGRRDSGGVVEADVCVCGGGGGLGASF
jgi:hypothetical protein